MGTIGQNFHLLASVDSTNNYAMAHVHAGTAWHGDTYFALEQTAGKGQREKKWVTTAGENILMSAVLYPAPLLFSDLPLLNMTISLSCYSLLQQFQNEKIKIKWPNDLYWNDRKAGGILIENGFQGNRWQFAVAGIGLNINQTLFPAYLPNPASLKQALGYDLDVIALAHELCGLLQTNYQRLMQGEKAALLYEYNQALYKLNQTVKLRQGNIVFPALIEGVDERGSLLVQSNLAQQFATGEVEWVVEDL